MVKSFLDFEDYMIGTAIGLTIKKLTYEEFVSAFVSQVCGYGYDLLYYTEEDLVFSK